MEFIIQEKIKRNSFSPIFQNLTKLVIFRLFSFRNVWRVAYIYKYINISSQFEISGTRSPRGVERGDKVSDVSARTSERIDF